MTFLQIALLLIAAVLAVAYGAVWGLRPVSAARSAIKTGSTALLALIAALALLPVVAMALACGAIGDWFLSRPVTRGLLPGLLAFAGGHVLYLALLLPMAGPVSVAGGVILTALGLLLLWRLWSGLGTLRLPVCAYAVLSVMLGTLALSLPAPLWLVTAGILAFVASDMVLAVEMFGLPGDHKAKPGLSRVLWVLYWCGQAAILVGLIHAASVIAVPVPFD